MKITNIVYSLIAAIAIVVILFFGKNILLPFVLAVMIWFMIKVVRNFVKKIKIKKKMLPVWFQNIVSFILIFGVLGLISKLLSANISKMYEVLPTYEKNILKITSQLNDLSGIDIVAELEEYSGDYDFSGILKSVFNSISELFADAFLVLLYVLFLLLEEAVFPLKIKAIFKNPEKYDNANSLIIKLDKSIHEYISLKTLVSIITGVASYIVLLIIGVDFAFFWAFLIFTLNYIPTIGSLIATIFPSLIALLQFGELTPFLFVLVFIGAIQVIVGNIIEPKIMGHSLNISSLVVLLALAFWGSIWGIVGMILSVPITVIIIIIFAQFSGTKNIAILLSENGKI